jgi:hypothetical protein
MGNCPLHAASSGNGWGQLAVLLVKLRARLLDPLATLIGNPQAVHHHPTTPSLGLLAMSKPLDHLSRARSPTRGVNKIYTPSAANFQGRVGPRRRAPAAPHTMNIYLV